MRTIQHPSQKTELFTLFVDMPISNFTKTESLSAESGVNPDVMSSLSIINSSRYLIYFQANNLLIGLPRCLHPNHQTLQIGIQN